MNPNVMQIGHLTIALLPLTLALTIASAAPSGAPRPNVLVILTDDQRWDALGVVQREQGERALFPWFQTPHLDRLAAEGARFANVFVTTSLCSPSRASLLSGRYARAHQVMNNFTEYPNALPSYPRRLKEAGYETAYIGKWHMGEDNDEQRPGFDHWMSHRGQGTTSTTSSTSTALAARCRATTRRSSPTTPSSGSASRMTAPGC